MTSRQRAEGINASALWLVGGLTLCGALARSWALRGLPIFGDEAIFLRLAGLIRRDPAQNLWASFQAAQAPAHSWLLALTLPLSADPVRAGRLSSVAVGIATIPAVAWLVCRIVAAFSARGEETRAAVPASVVAGALASFGPFFVFASRIARVDALFVLEAVVATGASVGLVVRAREGGSLAAPALRFGLLMGVTMLTRQAVSYPLWFLPVLASLALLSPRVPNGSALRRLARALAVAIVASIAVWAPMLVAPGALDLPTRVFHLAETHTPMGAAERLRLISANLAIALGSLWVYLTPPVFAFAVASILWLAWSRRRHLLVFLLGWELILLVPTIVFANAYFPRYALPASLPLVVAAAWGASRFWLRAGKPGFGRARAAVVAMLALALLSWSIYDVARGERDATRWPLHPIDRKQFLSGPSAGFASEAAAHFLEALAREGRITVLTPEFSGNPTDALWLLLGRNPRVRLSYALDALRRPLLAPVPGRPGAYRLPGDIRGRVAGEETLLEAGERVLAVSTEPLLTRQGWRPSMEVLGRNNPGLTQAARFDNPPGPDGRVESSVVVFRVR